MTRGGSKCDSIRACPTYSQGQPEGERKPADQAEKISMICLEVNRPLPSRSRIGK